MDPLTLGVIWRGLMAAANDVGGAVPGSQAVEGITEHYQEGLRLFPTRIWTGGEPSAELLRVIEANVRVPDKLLGDLMAMRNCNRIAEQRLQGIVARYGFDVYAEASDEILERSEVDMPQAI